MGVEESISMYINPVAMNRYISLSPSLFPLWLQQVEVATTKQEKKRGSLEQQQT